MVIYFKIYLIMTQSKEIISVLTKIVKEQDKKIRELERKIG